jgi:hypothetical protein
MELSTRESVLKEFQDLHINIMQNLNKMAKIYVDAITSDPEIKTEFREKFKDIPVEFWVRLEKVGRGSIIPELFDNVTVAGIKLQRCQVSDQKKFIDFVPVVTSTGDVLRVSIDALRPNQIKQVFAKDHVRSESEQRAFVESNKTIAAEEESKNKVVSVPYFVKKNKLYVSRGMIFIKQDLVKILEEMV